MQFRLGQLLTTSKSTFGDVFPPTLDPLKSTFSSACAPSAGHTCFISGSEHVNFLPTSTVLHTIWIRQHNNIANQLLVKLQNPLRISFEITFQAMNKKWTDEQIYQEARRIVIAQIQHISYNEFLPLLVGRESWKRFGLSPKESYTEEDFYNLKTDASVLNSFASIVGQFFFSLFESKLGSYTSQGIRVQERSLSDLFNDPSGLAFPDKLNSVLRYLIRESPPKVGLQMTEELRDKLFKNHGNFGLDLAALLLQTGRDHGIPSYTVWREKCGGSKVNRFEDLQDDIQNSGWLLPILQRAFASVDDVDLLILGLAEKPVRGALVGPTFSCIISLQFRKTKKGDRFWYENNFGPSAFTEEQQAEIKKTTMARIMCDNSGMGSVQPKVFEASDLYEYV